jgi:hypothetical protein
MFKFYEDELKIRRTNSTGKKLHATKEYAVAEA